MTPFAVFFLRQFFLGVNREIEEAAMLDGAGHLTLFFRIILPLSSAPITTLGILTFITAWNEYFWPSLVGQEENVRVLTVALSIFKSQTPQGTPDWAGLMAGTLVAAVPVILLFLAFGRRIVNSIQFSGIK
jgi:multiple sugar transport system permease protein